MDVRDTPISDSDIQCFNITSTLREILMECPIEFRDQYCSTETASDTDDGEPFEVNPQEDKDSSKESQSNEQKPSSRKEVESQRHLTIALIRSPNLIQPKNPNVVQTAKMVTVVVRMERLK